MEKRYTIKEVSSLLGVSTDALRLYEKEGLVSPYRDKNNGYRYYDQDDIKRILGITMYRKLDANLMEVNKFVNASKFDEIYKEMEYMVEEGEKEIIRIIQKNAKLRSMMQNVRRFQHEMGRFELVDMQDQFFVQDYEDSVINYDEMKNIVNYPNFPLGRICWVAKKDESLGYKTTNVRLCFFADMMKLCKFDNNAQFSEIKGGKAIRTTRKATTVDEYVDFLKSMEEAAISMGYKPKGEVHAYYILSKTDDDSNSEDYFEIYMPLA